MAVSARQQDLTAKARIRNTALELFAVLGEEGTSMRHIAADAGVTVGLIVHHFGTKDRLREEVERNVVEQFAEAIASVPTDIAPRDIGRRRDRAVAEMLAAQPLVVTYVRRAALGLNGPHSDLMRQLTQLAIDEVARARAAGPGLAGQLRRTHSYPHHDPTIGSTAPPADGRLDVGSARRGP
ncbi:TetR/AcrR family transcriptional regulator [Nocardioides sp. B-3]|uniref:TetR/AcrR family transcriptional regulator n=1 Tax=Nocardioides sp. B-3 TaxID=2895565 RepID=UPI0021538146|nr:TetR/AcrR family transcriptional regulator [Nocardioides sp. B-3]UUZ59535.1 TetR/AcrR family transcriptional regulator [Nocardioides sp. B-3]